MVDIELVVDKLDEMGLLRKDRIRNDYYTIYCPIHKGGQERKPSAGILLRDQYKNGQHYPAGFCHCFTCSYSATLSELITKLLEQKHISKTGVEWLSENIPGFDQTDAEIEPLIPDGLAQQILSKQATTYITLLKGQQSQTFISEEELAGYRYTVPYMYERKLNDAMIDKYDVGFDPNFIPPGRKKPVPCITFPVRDEKGRTLFLCRRSIEGKQFYMPAGVQKPVYGIWELPRGCRSVVICESCFNGITSTMYGRPAVALFGTGTPYQIEKLKRLGADEFILALDPDEAGDRGRVKLKKALTKHAIVWELSGIEPGKDINDLTKEEFDALELV